mgnify:CR=1 FL=1
MSGLFDPYALYCFNCGRLFADCDTYCVIFGPGTETCEACWEESGKVGTIRDAGAGRKVENAHILFAMAAVDEAIETAEAELDA